MSDWAFISHVVKTISRPRPGDAKHPTLWPSEASATVVKDGESTTYGRCRRNIFFRYMSACHNFYSRYHAWKPLVERIKREKVPVDDYMRFIWKQGELYEDFLVDAAKSAGVYLNGQSIVYIKDFNISGKTDIEVVNPDTSKRSVVEAKSVYGFGGNSTLGTDRQRANGEHGTPKDSNLMQIAIYDWWRASEDDAYEESRLTYGDRGTGRAAEFLVRTVDEEGIVKIQYKSVYPNVGNWITSPITINSILESYKYVQACIDGGIIPDRDFSIVYSEEQLAEAYEKGNLTKTEKTQYEKIQTRKIFNSWVESLADKSDSQVISEVTEADDMAAPVRAAIKNHADDSISSDKAAKIIRAKVKRKAELKQVKKGDWQCKYCSYKKTCFTDNGTPREV